MTPVTITKTFPLARDASECCVQQTMDFNKMTAVKDLAEKLLREGYVSVEHVVFRDRGVERVETTATIRVG